MTKSAATEAAGETKKPAGVPSPGRFCVETTKSPGGGRGFRKGESQTYSRTVKKL